MVTNSLLESKIKYFKKSKINHVCKIASQQFTFLTIFTDLGYLKLRDSTHEKMQLTKRFRKSTEKLWVKPMFEELQIKNRTVLSGK